MSVIARRISALMNGTKAKLGLLAALLSIAGAGEAKALDPDPELICNDRLLVSSNHPQYPPRLTQPLRQEIDGVEVWDTCPKSILQPGLNGV